MTLLLKPGGRAVVGGRAGGRAVSIFLESMDNKLLNARFPGVISLLEQILEKNTTTLTKIAIFDRVRS